MGAYLANDDNQGVNEAGKRSFQEQHLDRRKGLNNTKLIGCYVDLKREI